jgi:2-dehydro-3-deoxygluconokinase
MIEGKQKKLTLCLQIYTIRKNKVGNKFVTFGELMLRFSKEEKKRLSQGKTFYGNFGGSEANVAVSLAVQGDMVDYVTRLPSSQMGYAGAMKLRELGVGTSHILYGGNRIGVYYFEEAAALRNACVAYDRANSSYSELQPGMIDWRKALEKATVLHVSGITAAITQQAADATFEAIEVAEELGIDISIDLNYRKNLWRYEGALPRETLCRMMEHADVMFGDVIEYEFTTGHKKIPFTAVDNSFKMQVEEYHEWFENIHEHYPRCRKMMMGMRNELSSNHHLLTALLWADGNTYDAPVVDIPNVVDPMGCGDAFDGGFLHALRIFRNDENLKILKYSLAAAALKNTIAGDFNLSTEEEIMEVMESGFQMPSVKKYE